VYLFCIYLVLRKHWFVASSKLEKSIPQNVKIYCAKSKTRCFVTSSKVDTWILNMLVFCWKHHSNRRFLTVTLFYIVIIIMHALQENWVSIIHYNRCLGLRTTLRSWIFSLGSLILWLGQVTQIKEKG
jgi:hypothetical protein